MAKYLLMFQVCIDSARDRRPVEQSEEVIVECEPKELIKAVSAEKRALEARVRAAVERIDPAGAGRVSLIRSESLPS